VSRPTTVFDRVRSRNLLLQQVVGRRLAGAPTRPRPFGGPTSALSRFASSEAEASPGTLRAFEVAPPPPLRQSLFCRSRWFTGAEGGGRAEHLQSTSIRGRVGDAERPADRPRAEQREEGGRRQESRREEKEAEKKAGRKKRKRTRRRTRLRMRSTTGTRSSMAPGPITARTGVRIDGAMQSSDESFWGSLS
jgi:hypothetical protein